MRGSDDPLYPFLSEHCYCIVDLVFIIDIVSCELKGKVLHQCEQISSVQILWGYSIEKVSYGCY